MTVRINGKEREVGDPATVAALLAELGVDPRNVAVECDGAIIPRERLAAEPVRRDACFEIIHFVGGG